ncbi:hypothetical protein ACLOJK_007521 [Asimina triloba]
MCLTWKVNSDISKSVATPGFVSTDTGLNRRGLGWYADELGTRLVTDELGTRCTDELGARRILHLHLLSQSLRFHFVVPLDLQFPRRCMVFSNLLHITPLH